ncbi:MAG: diguanylate cyclase [Chloroflexi bacterium]|nr:diguanylate cyclase [Chloroflexota bacterium]
MDSDALKHVNGRRGHAAGNDLLVALANTIRERVSAAAYAASGGAGVERSVSVGVATHPRSETKADQLFQRADEALYRAKHAGKNTAVAAPSL